MKLKFTFSLGLLLVFMYGFGQNDLPAGKSILQNPEINTRINSVGYWSDLAKRGLIPFNPVIPVPPAQPLKTKNGLGVTDQMSTDVVIYNETGVTQSENSVFVDPNNNQHILNSNNSESGGGIYGADYFNSPDAGQTWNGSKFGAGGTNKGDPAACIGLNARQYIGFITSARGQGIAYSDNGTAWTPVTVAPGVTYPDLLDKNHLWIDNTNSTQEGNLYSAWTCFVSASANNNDILFSRSTTNGVSWSTPANISNAVAAGSHNQGVNISCNNTGWVFAVWAIYDTWPSDETALGFARSNDGGASWFPASRIITNIKGIRNTGVTPNMRCNSFPSMAIDVSGGTYHGTQYVVWTNIGTPGVNTGTNKSIYLIKSTNGGTVWSSPVRVNQGAFVNGEEAYFPWITCDPVTGKLFVVFYDTRNTANTSVETFVAYSEDGGATWADFRVSDVSFTPSPIPGLAAGYFGDYLGISASNNWVYPTWTDNRSGRALTYVSPVHFSNYCIATGGCDEYISNVNIGTINNSSACEGYQNFTNLSTNIPGNSSAGITVTNGNSYIEDQCGIWVDWNNNGVFLDPGEAVTVSGSPGGGPYTAVIDPPPGTTLGAKTMRIRLTYTGSVSPCGSAQYGEVEDYTINVSAALPNVWNGSWNQYWHNATNWSLGHIPTVDEPVEIPDVGYQPVLIDYYNEECNGLTIGAGAQVEVRPYELAVHNDLVINGQLGITNSAGVIRSYDNVIWNAGSTANFTAGGVFWVYGNWNFNSGANANLTNGYVDFTGPGYSWIRSFSATCALPTIGNYKTGADWTLVSNLSTQPLTINGSIYNQPSCNFGISSSQDVILKGSLYNNGNYDFTAGANTGTFVFDGATQTIDHLTTGTGLFNNVRFSSSTSTTAASNITVAKNLTIDQGSFNPGSTTVTVGGDWTNTVGTTGFVEGTSRVIFNGAGHQYVYSNETFNILEANMGAALRVNNPAYTVTCNQYDWTSGGIDVLSGTFTALDLADNGIFGSFYTNPGGTINLYQDGVQYVDLDGNLYFTGGGTINVYGGNGDSWWPYLANASITMDGGVLDFKNNGIYIPASSGYSFTTNITGGTIRTAGGFSGNRADFTPTAGIFEFYGPSDALISQSNGSTLFNVVINKGSKDGSLIEPGLQAPGERVGPPTVKGGKANAVSLNSNFAITNNLLISTGTMNIGAFTGSVTGGVSVYGTLNETDPLGVLNVGTFIYNHLHFFSGSNGHLSNGNIYLKSWIAVDAGASFNASVNNTIHFTGNNPGGGLGNSEPTAVFGNLDVNKTANAVYLASDYSGPYNIQGNLTLQPGNSLQTGVNSIHINGIVTDGSTTSVYLYYPAKGNNTQYASLVPSAGESPKSGSKGGSLTIDTDFTLNGLLDVSDGNALVHGRFAEASTGALKINGGSFIADSPNHPSKGWEYLNGNLTISAGLCEITHNSTIFGPTATTNITGGTLRTGGAFAADQPGTFLPTGGLVEVVGAEPDVNIFCGNGNFFYDLLINRAPGTASYLAWYNIIVKNDLTIQNGTLYANGYDINVGRNWTNNVGTSGFVEGTGTVVFDGALPADILTSETFYNLSVNKTYAFFDALELYHDVTVSNDFHVYDGSVKFRSPANLTVTGNITIDLNAGLNAADGYGPQIFIGKDWANANTSYDATHGFHPGNYSTVTFNGTIDQLLSTASPQEDFAFLVVNKGSGKFKPQDNVRCFGNIQITNGSWEDNVAGLTHHVYNNFTVAASGAFLNAFPLNTVEFNGAQNSILTYSSGTGYFHNLTVNKSTGYSVTQVGNTSCQFGGNLNIQQGAYNLNGYSLSVFGNTTINNFGTLTLPPSSLLIMSDAHDLNVNSGGILQITGTSGSQVNVRANLTASRFTFNVNSGGTIAADYCVFKNMTANGVYVQSGATVDAAHAFKGCTFQDGASAGTLLTINNNQTLTIRNTVFPTNTWGGSSNVSKTINQGHLYFVDYGGGFSGELYDNDAFNLIDWVPTLTATPSANPASICPAGTSQLNANPLGGLSPYASYAWTPAGTLNNPSIANPVASPAATTVYHVVVTDALGTTGSGDVTVTVNPFLPVSVSIAASSNPVPPATNVTFTATPVNGGSSPSYQWKVNNINVGTGLSTYSYIPVYNDHVTCVLNSNYQCVSGNPATSNTITMIVVATNTTVNGSVPSPLNLCFDASNTITVAGGGSTFVVQSGGSATLIAGNKISFLYGTTVQSGGYMHGYITTANAYCGSLPPAMVAMVAGEQEQPEVPVSHGFTIFPNPATGKFTLLQKGETADGIVKVEIMAMYGEQALSETLINERQHEFNVSGLAVGLYLVKVVKDGRMEVFKLILTR